MKIKALGPIELLLKGPRGHRGRGQRADVVSCSGRRTGSCLPVGLDEFQVLGVEEREALIHWSRCAHRRQRRFRRPTTRVSRGRSP